MRGGTGFGTTRLGKSRNLVFAFGCLAMLAGGCLESKADGAALDTSRLPRIGGSKEVFANAAWTIYTSPQPVAATAEFVGKALAAEGWQSYVAPLSARAENLDMRIMSLKKGPQGLTVYITVAPAQNNATSVSYSAIALKTDLPFPKDAADIEYSPDRPMLICKSAEAVDKLLDFYRKELAASGWSLWSDKVGGKQPDGGSAGELTAKGAYAFYIRDNTQPLSLVLQRGDDGRVNVEIKGVSAEILALERQAEVNKNEPPQLVAAAAPEAKPAKQKTADDDMADDIMKHMQQTIRSVTADALSGAKALAPPPQSQAAAETLHALAGNDAPIPVPDTAQDVEFDGSDGKLEFNSPSSVASVAAFYRSAMKPQGWKEKTSVINRPNMMVLDFSKGGKAITLTIIQMGPKTNVSADGSALVTAAAKPDAAPSDKAAAADAPTPVTAEDMEAEESGGLPVPKRHTMAVGEKNPFRRELNANVPVDLATVLTFYRRELSKLNWKEDGKGAVAAADRAVIAFASTEGPAILTLSRKDNETIVKLVVKDPEAAKKAGILPKPGQTKILFGNILPAEGTITFNSKAIKVAGGAGTKAPDGPSLDLAPGKYKYSIKAPGKPAQNDEVEVGADEIWGLMIGPRRRAGVAGLLNRAIFTA
jgi:hypothetical protein